LIGRNSGFAFTETALCGASLHEGKITALLFAVTVTHITLYLYTDSTPDFPFQSDVDPIADPLDNTK
jgi:hypothetical protein